VAIIGIVQANIEFQSDVVTLKKRPLPPSLRDSGKIDWHFTATPVTGERGGNTPNGATFGVVGKF